MLQKIPSFFDRAFRRRSPLSDREKFLFSILPFNLFAWFLLVLYMLPLAFMVVTAFMSTEQLSDPRAPLYPAKLSTYPYQGREYAMLNVPMDQGVRQLALVKRARAYGEFVDPQRPEAGPARWDGNWRALERVYTFHPVWDNFTVLVRNLPFPLMLRNTLFLTLIGGLGVLVSSIVIAYGFSRFPLPGGDLLFYVLIATILIPDKVTYIPTFFFYVNSLHWIGTYYPLLVHLFFGNAVYIFLLRQNFKTIPIDVEEAAMIDGAGPLRRLFSIVLPQSWPVVVTISMLHFFYSWNETRLASLYVGSNQDLMPLSFGIQNYQSFVPIQNIIQASTLVVMVVPVIVLLLSQRFFLHGLVITGMEK